MAVFEYKCYTCKLRVERFFRKDAPETVKCSECGGSATKQLADFGFVFGDGKVPGNTGVDSLDTNYDKRIGRDAQGRWEYIKDRETRKRQVQRENGGVKKVPLRINEEGDYEPMPKPAVDRFVRSHKEYDKLLREHRKEREAEGIPRFDD